MPNHIFRREMKSKCNEGLSTRRFDSDKITDRAIDVGKHTKLSERYSCMMKFCNKYKAYIFYEL